MQIGSVDIAIHKDGLPGQRGERGNKRCLARSPLAADDDQFFHRLIAHFSKPVHFEEDERAGLENFDARGPDPFRQDRILRSGIEYDPPGPALDHALAMLIRICRGKIDGDCVDRVRNAIKGWINEQVADHTDHWVHGEGRMPARQEQHNGLMAVALRLVARSQYRDIHCVLFSNCGVLAPPLWGT